MTAGRVTIRNHQRGGGITARDIGADAALSERSEALAAVQWRGTGGGARETIPSDRALTEPAVLLIAARILLAARIELYRRFTGSFWMGATGGECHCSLIPSSVTRAVAWVAAATGRAALSQVLNFSSDDRH